MEKLLFLLVNRELDLSMNVRRTVYFSAKEANDGIHSGNGDPRP